MPPSPHSQHYLQHGIRKEKLCFYLFFFFFLLKTFPLWWIVSTIKTLVLSLRALLCWVWWTARPNIYGVCAYVFVRTCWGGGGGGVLFLFYLIMIFHSPSRRGGEKIPEKRLIFIGGFFFLFNVSRNFLFRVGRFEICVFVLLQGRLNAFCFVPVR